jgi:cytochrome bd ubiquinol oxidase subunit II
LIGVMHFSRKQEDRKAFACSSLYLGLMLVGATVALYPRLLPSSDNPDRDITIEKAAAGSYALHIGLLWWAVGLCLALTYFFIVYRMFLGKVRAETGGYGH